MSYAPCDRCAAHTDETTEVNGMLLCPECTSEATCENCDRPDMSTTDYPMLDGSEKFLCLTCMEKLSAEAEATLRSQMEEDDD